MTDLTPGQRLYERWCGSEVSNAARYYDLMNPAVREDWERLGEEWDALVAVTKGGRFAFRKIPNVPIAMLLAMREALTKARAKLAEGEIRKEWRRNER